MLAFNLNESRKAIIIIYLVGAIGISIPLSHPVFVALTPFALLFSTGILAYEKFYIEKSAFSVHFYAYAAFTYFFSLFIEMVGVNTGWPFGNYTYLSALGIKVFGTPLLIGLNWFIMVYCSAVLFNFIKNIFLKSVVASLSMVIFDLIMEQVACFTQMWCWQNHIIPIRNYIAWFIIAFILHSIAAWFKIPFSSRIAPLLFMAQFGYFVVIYIVLKLFAL